MCLVLTSAQPPAFRDKFWRIWEMVREWNFNIKEFIAGWVICLDESMSIWLNRRTCPGWIFCPRKPHPFRNEWHTACCGMSGVMISTELVEGKDAPPDIQVRNAEHGKTTGLFLRMLTTYYYTGTYVVLDSGFCVLKVMATGGPLGVTDSCKWAKRKWREGDRDVLTEIQYAAPYDWHFRYRHAVDNHSNLRHAMPSAEES